MYIYALKYGVPMMKGDEILKRGDVQSDFDLFPETIAAFNRWLKTTISIGSVEDAIKHGMTEMLAWRTLRAQPDTPDYVTSQAFFLKAREDGMTPHKVANNLDRAKEADPKLKALNQQLRQLQQQQSQLTNSNQYPANMPQLMELDSPIDATKTAIARQTEVVCGEVAHPKVKPDDPDPPPARPGEGAGDVTTNDQNDLRQGAEEMRLLLGHLHPEERVTRWKVTVAERVVQSRNAYPSNAGTVTTLSVPHEQPGTDTPRVTLTDSGILLASTWSTILDHFSPSDDLLAAPARGVLAFLKQHASMKAANQLHPDVVRLLDDYVHDSRIWFRVPWFHEYAPGGYGWPRVIFEGGKKRIAYLGLTAESELLAAGDTLKAGWA
jgi:hypothetical protein